jgi:hypothetical protein
VTGIALSFDSNAKVNGYWLVADDGGVFTYGQAPFWGSSGGNDGGSRVISIAANPGLISQGPFGLPPQTAGYAWVHADGRIEVVSRPVALTKPELLADPASLTFPATSVGVASNARKLKLINKSQQENPPITLTGINTSSDVEVTSGGTCTEGTTLAPKQECTIEVKMTPSSTGENSGGVVITSDAADDDLTVTTSTDGK